MSGASTAQRLRTDFSRAKKHLGRVKLTEFFETEARRCGYRFVAGLDEAGRGPLAGPVVAAAVILPRRCPLTGLQDSKQVAEPERERLYGEIARCALGVGIGVATAREIDAKIGRASCRERGETTGAGGSV